jgi:hypothetical protein
MIGTRCSRLFFFLFEIRVLVAPILSIGVLIGEHRRKNPGKRAELTPMERIGTPMGKMRDLKQKAAKAAVNARGYRRGTEFL